MEQLLRHINKLLKEHNIVLKYWKRSYGEAFYEENLIKVPQIDSIDRCCIALHEIAHCIFPQNKRQFELEYECEMFALKEAARFVPKSQLKSYREGAKKYVIYRLSLSHNKTKNLEVEDIPLQIIKFININIKKWKGKRVKVRNWNFSEKKPISIKIY